MIQFDKETHTYWIDGIKAIGVNELMGSFDIGGCEDIPAHILEPARDFGTKGHTMAKYHLQNRLNEGKLDNKLFPYLVGLKKLLIDHKIVPLAVEEPICYKALLACGTPDLRCMFDEVHTILDFKFVKALRKHYHLQLGGYKYIYNIGHSPEDEVKQGVIIQLLPNDYKLVMVDADAENEFCNLLISYHVRKKYQNGKKK